MIKNHADFFNNANLQESSPWNGRQKAVQSWFYLANNILITLLRKTQCNCVLIKVLIQLFQKLVGVLGWNHVGSGWGEFLCLFLSFFPHPSLKWHLPPREGFRSIANGFTKNAMKLHFDKSFCPVFSKTGGVLGQRPKVLTVI